MSLIWREHRANNMESNPISFWFAIDYSSKYNKTYRYFYIIPQYPSKDGVTIKDGDDPELYVLFEGRCTEYEKGDIEYETRNGRGWEYFEDLIVFEENGEVKAYWDSSKSTFLRAYKTMDEAKHRSDVNIAHMKEIIETCFGGTQEDE